MEWRVVGLTYEANNHDSLTADARVLATLEAIRPAFLDGCGEAHDARPPIPETARPYQTTGACKAANALRWRAGRPQNHERHVACCAVESQERRPGERFQSSRTTRFGFHERHWEAQVDEPGPDAPRPYRRNHRRVTHLRRASVMASAL